MVVALGFWALAIGYATLYTGVQGFTTGSGSLGANLGLSSLVSNGTGNQTQAATTTGSASNLSSVAAATSAAATAGTAAVVV